MTSLLLALHNLFLTFTFTYLFYFIFHIFLPILQRKALTLAFLAIWQSFSKIYYIIIIILVSVRRVLREGSIEDRTASVVLIMSSAWRKFTQRRTTARRSTTVAVDLPLFAPIFLQLLVLDGVERLFGHDQAPSKCLPHLQVSGNLLFFATCASLPRRWIVHSPLYFFYKFSQFRAAIEVAEQSPNKRRARKIFSVILAKVEVNGEF